jgi:predicted transcriptional regulator
MILHRTSLMTRELPLFLRGEGRIGMSETSSQLSLKQLTAQIVAAHTAHNQVTSEALLQLIGNVYRALAGNEQAPASGPKSEPAVPVKRSVFPDHIVCLECGQKLTMLKRHLRGDHGMTPEQYRNKWNLPPRYPMVAADYAARRSEMAKRVGLGQRSVAKQTEPAKAETKPPTSASRRLRAGSK